MAADLPPDERPRCTATSVTTGERCKRRPRPGSKTCVKHGSGAPQVRAAAARRVAEREVVELVELLEVDVPEFASAAEAARFVLHKVTKRAAQFGALADNSADLVYLDGLGREQLRAAILGEHKWLESLTRVLAVVAQAEQAAGRTDHSQIRDQILQDVAFVLKHCLTTVAIRHSLDIEQFEAEFYRAFNATIDWAVRNADGSYGPDGDRPTRTGRHG